MLFNERATDALSERPKCNVCKPFGAQPAIADGKTNYGPWGYLCAEHFRKYGSGLGMGRGQILLCGDEHDTELIATYLGVVSPPGSMDAHAHGCVCWTKANAFGRGAGTVETRGMLRPTYHFNSDCPLHGAGDWIDKNAEAARAADV
jgi:hypothetical protein